VFIIIGIVALLLIIFLVRLFIYKKQNIPARSYSAALQNENNGDYEKALINYEIALSEINKSKHNNTLRIKIIEKIKVLHTVVQYEKNLFYLNKNL
jgi:hypothetical protein